MTEPFRYHLGMDALFQKPCCMGMAQVMESNIRRDTRLCQQSLENLVREILRVFIGTVGVPLSALKIIFAPILFPFYLWGLLPLY